LEELIKIRDESALIAKEYSIVKDNYQKSLPLIEKLQNEKKNLADRVSELEKLTSSLNGELTNLKM